MSKVQLQQQRDHAERCYETLSANGILNLQSNAVNKESPGVLASIINYNNFEVNLP